MNTATVHDWRDSTSRLVSRSHQSLKKNFKKVMSAINLHGGLDHPVVSDLSSIAWNYTLMSAGCDDLVMHPSGWKRLEGEVRREGLSLIGWTDAEKERE